MFGKRNCIHFHVGGKPNGVGVGGGGGRYDGEVRCQHTLLTIYILICSGKYLSHITLYSHMKHVNNFYF